MFIFTNLLHAIASVIDTLLSLYFWVVIISALLSWVNPDPYNPIVRILHNLTEPVFYRVRKWLPFTYIGGMSGISMDVPPYVILSGTRNRMRISGINKIGMRRNGVSREAISCLEQAFKIIFRSLPQTLLVDNLEETKQSFPDCPEVQNLVNFFKTSKRGVVKRTELDK